MSHRQMLPFVVALICSNAGGLAHGQGFPGKPLRIVASGPGGSADFSARLIAQGLVAPLGQQVLVDNRPSGVIPGDVVAKAAPDGYTLLLAGSTMWMAPLLQDAPFDPVKDFAPITQVCRIPSVIVVHPSLPVKTVRELIALAKARPGALNYASTGLGGSTHLATEYFRTLAGIDIVRVNYKGTGPALNALMGGEVQVMFPTVSSAMPFVKSGRLRALAIGSAQSSSLAPDLPTVTATGLPGYDSVAIYGLFAPARTPETVVTRLNQEVGKVLENAEAKTRLLGAGVEAAVSSPGQLAAVMKSEMSALGKIIKDMGIRGE